MAQATWGADQTQFFFELTPDRVLDAVEASGLHCTGRCLTLNSFENRVYDVELDLDDEDSEEGGQSSAFLASRRIARSRIAKFYRPGRWNEAQILEEHAFLDDLAQNEIPVVAPLPFPDGSTLRKTPAGDIWYALFPKIGGRAPEELTDEQLIRIGRLLGRIHNTGAARDASHRLELTPAVYGWSNLEFLLKGNWIPLDLQSRYEQVAQRILVAIEPFFSGVATHRIHGDCHLGNLLWSPQGPFFVDFDDMLRGPAVQDLWLLISTRDETARAQMDRLLQGYEEMREFDRRTLRLVEPLRALRFIHYSAWLARRWSDPAFPAAFPNFGSHHYWLDEIQDLEEQWRLIQGLT